MPHALMGHYRCVGHIPTLYMRLDATCATGRQKPLFTHTHTHPQQGGMQGWPWPTRPQRLYAPYVWVLHAFSHPNVAKPRCSQPLFCQRPSQFITGLPSLWQRSFVITSTGILNKITHEHFIHWKFGARKSTSLSGHAGPARKDAKCWLEPRSMF